MKTDKVELDRVGLTVNLHYHLPVGSHSIYLLFGGLPVYFRYSDTVQWLGSGYLTVQCKQVFAAKNHCKIYIFYIGQTAKTLCCYWRKDAHAFAIVSTGSI